jgi:hypothetical protein
MLSCTVLLQLTPSTVLVLLDHVQLLIRPCDPHSLQVPRVQCTIAHCHPHKILPIASRLMHSALPLPPPVLRLEQRVGAARAGKQGAQFVRSSPPVPPSYAPPAAPPSHLSAVASTKHSSVLVPRSPRLSTAPTHPSRCPSGHSS